MPRRCWLTPTESEHILYERKRMLAINAAGRSSATSCESMFEMMISNFFVGSPASSLLPIAHRLISEPETPLPRGPEFQPSGRGLGKLLWCGGHCCSLTLVEQRERDGKRKLLAAWARREHPPQK